MRDAPETNSLREVARRDVRGVYAGPRQTSHWSGRATRQAVLYVDACGMWHAALRDRQVNTNS